MVANPPSRSFALAVKRLPVRRLVRQSPENRGESLGEGGSAPGVFLPAPRSFSGGETSPDKTRVWSFRPSPSGRFSRRRCRDRAIATGSARCADKTARVGVNGQAEIHCPSGDMNCYRTLETTVKAGQRRITAAGNVGLLDVSQFAGKQVTIRFELRSGGSEGFDVIGFTQTATEGVLSPPSKLTHTSSGKDFVTLTWAPSTESVLGYEVFSTPNRETAFTNRISGNLITETTYTYSGNDATGRFYQVRAVGSSSRSGIAVTRYSGGATHKVP